MIWIFVTDGDEQELCILVDDDVAPTLLVVVKIMIMILTMTKMKMRKA